MWLLTKTLHFLYFHFWAFIFSARAYCIPCRSGEEWVWSPQPAFFGRALCAQEWLSFNIKTPKLRKENTFSVSAALISPAKFFLFLKAVEALLRWKAAPSLGLPLCSLRSCFLWRASRTERENSSYRRPSRTLPHISYLFAVYRCLFLLLFPFTVWGLVFSPLPFYSSVHTFASYYFSSDCAGENSLVYITCFEVVQITVM